jgi:hypothetical protein
MIHRDQQGKSTASLPKQYRTPVDYSTFEMYNPYSVLFVWHDEIEEEFAHSSGLVIARTLAKDRDRWGQVVKTHPTSTLQVGEFILIDKPAFNWGTVINGLEHWMVYEDDIRVACDDAEITKTFKGDVKAITLEEINKRHDNQ